MGIGTVFYGCVFTQILLIDLKDCMALILGEGGGKRPDRLIISPSSVAGDVCCVRSLTWTVARRRYYLEL